jgi:isoquinoline 1-oxidoreductase beta subunit
MTTIQNVSRRGFLKGAVSASAFVLSVRYLPESLHAEGLPGNARIDHAAFHPGIFVGIESDGTVRIIAHRSEMGTTSRTSLPLILADELEADWKRVKIEQALGDERYGSQNTDGSHSIREFFEPMRQAGATARQMLTQAAANQWKVPVEECKADLHTIVHTPTARRLGYGALAAAAAKLPVPKIEDLKFKPKSAWRYIGKGSPSYDLPQVVTGKAVYGMDARMDGMVYASIERPPVVGGKVKSFDDKETLKVAGVSRFRGRGDFSRSAALQSSPTIRGRRFKGAKSCTSNGTTARTPATTQNSTRRNCRRNRTRRQRWCATRETWTLDLPAAERLLRRIIMCRTWRTPRWSRWSPSRISATAR